MKQLDNLNVLSITPIVTPAELKAKLPLTESAAHTVDTGRNAVRAILDQEDRRMMIITGPCSIHDCKAAYDYAERLRALASDLEDRILLLMRTYFEKPRTTVGWKGLLNDPNLDGSFDVPSGLSKAREILLRIAEIGVPAAVEFLDPIVPQYLADLVSWASIGARTSESQTHREMASGLSMPVGFKNSTDGNLQVAVDALLAAREQHHFMGIDSDGRTGVVTTRGNPWAHIILRGGRGRPNYDPVSVIETAEMLNRMGLPQRIVIDCSHANCGKRHELQAHVLNDVIQQRIEGRDALVGVMIESNLKGGRQLLPKDLSQLEYGVSITDACLGWETTESLLRQAYEKLGAIQP